MHMYTFDKKTKNITLAAFFLALSFLLPFLTANNKELGTMLCLMHFPIFIAAFFIDYKWVGIIGFLAPIFRSLIIGMPQMIPTALSMAFELLTYGIVTCILYNVFPKKTKYIYLSLFIAMIAGRIVSGIAKAIILGATGSKLTFEVFLVTNVVKTLPGIFLQLLIIPILVLAIKKNIKR